MSQSIPTSWNWDRKETVTWTRLDSHLERSKISSHCSLSRRVASKFLTSSNWESTPNSSGRVSVVWTDTSEISIAWEKRPFDSRAIHRGPCESRSQSAHREGSCSDFLRVFNNILRGSSFLLAPTIAVMIGVGIQNPYPIHSQSEGSQIDLSSYQHRNDKLQERRVPTITFRWPLSFSFPSVNALILSIAKPRYDLTTFSEPKPWIPSHAPLLPRRSWNFSPLYYS